MWYKTVFSAIIFCIVLSASAAFCANEHKGNASDSTHQKWWAQLNLTEDQKAKLKTLRSEMQDFRKANFDKMKTLRDKTKEELLKLTPSKTILYGYAKDMADLHKAMAEHMADHMLTMKTILTKEQFEKLVSNEFWQGMGPMHRGHGSHEGKLEESEHRGM